MKKLYTRVSIHNCLCLLVFLSACKKDFLEKKPQGTLSETTLANKAGVNGLLIGAYSLLDGVGGPTASVGVWSQSISNWQYGGVASDDAHKGSEYGDQTDLELIENYTHTPVNPYFDGKWVALYTGVQRANDVLRVLTKVEAGALTDDEALQIKAEAVFLRAVYHFEAAKMWLNIPYVSDSVSFENNNYQIPNTESVWPKIEADLQFAATNLSELKSDVGRANTWAARAFLAKAYIYQHKFAEAKPLLEDIIDNGTNPAGVKYALVNYSDNFNPSTKNSAESVFAVQMSVNDNAGGENGNLADVLNYGAGGPANCCGFYQPSFSLVNSFKTDPGTGLPLLDTWNESDVKNDQGIASTSPFDPYTGTLDPRLDHTVGRRGIPYLDWGIMPGASWIVSQAAAGPYLPIKHIYYKAEKTTTSEGGGQTNSNNYTMIRFADILLWAAETEVEIGTLAEAQKYVNLVRARAADPANWVKTYIDNDDPSKGFTNTPAANYKIGLYTNEFEVQGQDFARKAVRFERKIELAMEGHRFFDLQRWDNGSGYMADVLNNYIYHETHIAGYNYLYMNGASFTKGKNELFPIPQVQIDLSKVNGTSVLKQNPGY